MKIPKIANSMEYVDDELITAAEKVKKAKFGVFRWTALAACFLVIVIAGVIVLPPLFKNTENPTSFDPRYKDFETYTTDSAIIWPWEYLAESEKPYETEFDGIKYDKNSGKTISENYIGDKIGTYTITGYDELSDEQPTITADAYTLKNISKTEYIAIKIDNNFYPFKNSVYNPPLTLGELFERLDLSSVFKLERFSEKSDGPDGKHYILTSDDDYIWEVLSTCKDAKFIDENEVYWHPYERDFISFTISSDALGINKHTLLITNDGYLDTNAFDWGYLYYIGEEASEKIIKYAMKNSTKTEFEPYQNTKYVTGEITEITDEYILIDDSILCKNAEDGITYKLPTDNIRILRHILMQLVKVGDMVEINYNGEIDKENGNIITDAFDISDVQISFEAEEDEGESSKTDKKTSSYTVSVEIAE